MATINRKQLGSHKRNGSSKASYGEQKNYYNNQIWKSNRERYLEQHPICEICYQHGRIEAATCVHHMIPWSRGIDEKHKEMLLTNPDNFMSLCSNCHKWLHIKDDRSHQDILNYLSPKEYEEAHNLKWLK